jgi:asparagine synthetase B (glutamine-hydrolysing)
LTIGASADLRIARPDSLLPPAEWRASIGPPNARHSTGNDVEFVVHSEGDRIDLRVITDSRGSAPESAARVGRALIFMGELYNAKELAKFAGVPLVENMTSAKAVLETYLARGEAVLGQIRGVFALIIWDPQHNLILCARDRMGVYPLFYTNVGPTLLASTSARALLRHPDVSTEINRAALADRLCGRFYNMHETSLAHVQRVPAGHVLRVIDGKREVRQYWNPFLEGASTWETGDVLQKFEAAMGTAIRRSLTPGRTAIFLSGGLDSVSVAALALDAGLLREREPPLALSLIFPHQDCYEEPVQRSVGRALGLEHLFVTFEEAVGNGGLVAAGLRSTSTFALPMLNVWMPAYEYLGRQGAQRGCSTILTGGGGDEWLGVTPFLAANLIRRGDIAGLVRLYNSQRRSYTTSPTAMLRKMLWKFGMRPLIAGAAADVLRRTAPGTLLSRKRRYISRTTPDWVAPDRALRHEIDARAEEFIEDPRLGDFYMMEGQKALGHQLTSMEAEGNFEMGRRLGVKIAAPYWDADVIDLLHRVHPETLNLGGRSKGLVRGSIARRFPDLGFGRQKKIIAVNYFAETVYSQWRPAWESLGGVGVLESLGIVHSGRLQRSAGELLASGKQKGSFPLWDVLNLESWARQYT